MGVRPKLEDIVAYARKRETASIGKGGDKAGIERMLLLADDRDACRVAIAWSNTEIEWARPRWELTVDKGSTWKRRPRRAIVWAWEGISIDLEELAFTANLDRVQTLDRFRMLRQNLLIYPDGTLSPIAEMTIAQITKRRLEARG